MQNGFLRGDWTQRNQLVNHCNNLDQGGDCLGEDRGREDGREWRHRRGELKEESEGLVTGLRR